MFSWQNTEQRGKKKIENNFQTDNKNIGRRVDDLIGDSLHFKLLFLFLSDMCFHRKGRKLYFYIDRKYILLFLGTFVCLFWVRLLLRVYNNAVVLLIWRKIKLFDSPDIIKKEFLLLLFFCRYNKQIKKKINGESSQ